MEFVKLHVPSLQPETTPAGPPIGWPEVDEKVSPSTVLILVKKSISTDGGLER